MVTTTVSMTTFKHTEILPNNQLTGAASGKQADNGTNCLPRAATHCSYNFQRHLFMQGFCSKAHTYVSYVKDADIWGIPTKPKWTPHHQFGMPYITLVQRAWIYRDILDSDFKSENSCCRDSGYNHFTEHNDSLFWNLFWWQFPISHFEYQIFIFLFFF